MSEKEFLDQESSSIILEMTSKPFGIDDQLWLYWLFRLELIPGGWDATFYLEEDSCGTTKHSFNGFGNPKEAVMSAYNLIDRDWLKKGFERGEVLQRQYDNQYRAERKKQQYWQYFVAHDELWGYGFTKHRLEKVRQVIWDDENFWGDILDRHDGWKVSPEEMLEQNKSVYEHCMGNMTGMIMQTLVQKKLVRGGI